MGDYKVLIRTNTYNQAQFITDTLLGVSTQQTDFPFVCLVMDDASTDGEQEVIKSFFEKECDVEQAQYDEIEEANIVFIPHKTNRNCKFAFYFLKKNLYGTGKKQPLVKEWEDNCKYIAMCEGDDYWTDPLKLQKQVDFLESHPDVSLSCCRYFVSDPLRSEKFLYPNKRFDSQSFEHEHYLFSRDDAFRGEWVTKTLTCVFRRSAYNANYISQFKYGRDVHLIYNVLSSGIGVCHSFVGGVYHISENGVFGGKSTIDQIKINYKVFEEFSSKVKDPVLKEKAKTFWISLFRSHEWPSLFSWLSIQCYLLFFVQKLSRMLR